MISTALRIVIGVTGAFVPFANCQQLQQIIFRLLWTQRCSLSRNGLVGISVHIYISLATFGDFLPLPLGGDGRVSRSSLSFWHDAFCDALRQLGGNKGECQSFVVSALSNTSVPRSSLVAWWKRPGADSWFWKTASVAVESRFCSSRHFCSEGSRVSFNYSIWDWASNFLKCGNCLSRFGMSHE